LPSIKDIADYGGAFNWPSATDIVSTAKEAVEDPLTFISGVRRYPKDVLDWATTPEAVARTGDVETDFDAYARAQQAQQLAAEYGDMYQEEFSDFPYNRGINASGTNLAYREAPTWEERYPLAPQEWGVDDAGLADRQWIDPHPQALNIDLNSYYGIPPDKRHLFGDKNPPWAKSRWDASRSAGGTQNPLFDPFWNTERMPVDVSYPPAPIFPPPVVEEAISTAPVVPQRDVLDRPWMGVDEDALPYDPDIRYGDRRTEVGDFDNFVGDTKFREYTDRNPDVMEGLSSEKVSTLLDNPALQEAYLRERWYLTNQRFFARDYKKDELFRTPGPRGHMVSREPEFFKLM